VTDLSPLSGLTELRSLNLINCAHVTDLSPLANLTKLARLELSGTKPDSLARTLAGGIEGRRSANRCGTRHPESAGRGLYERIKPGDLSPLGHLTNLRFLGSYCGKETGVSYLRNLTNLEELDLYDSRYLRDLSPFKKLTNLKELDLCGAYGGRDRETFEYLREQAERIREMLPGCLVHIP
jgi:Leucine-rich repeat (LRR) protein